jgi:hypothetical protein
MAELVKETITTQKVGTKPVKIAPVVNVATSSQTFEYLVYFFFGVLEILLTFRLVLKITGASIGSAFVGLIYGLTGMFIIPFEGIFRRGFTQGVETTAVIEPSTLVAIIVYAILAWGIVKLIRIFSGEKQPEE